MIDLPLLLHEKERKDRNDQLDAFGILLAAGGRSMDQQGYKEFYEGLVDPLREIPVDDTLDAQALDALRRRLTGG